MRARRSVASMNTSDVEHAVAEVAEEWRGQRAERQARRHLERADFDRLRAAGFLEMAVPESMGGSWRDVATSTRPVCNALRTLAGADPSVALVSSMHPAVIGFWLARPDESPAAWVKQREAVFASAAEGHQWGTITSEPGSGGDIARTKSTATPDATPGAPPGDTYRVTGDKHLGSGSGVPSFMITTPGAAGEGRPMGFP